MVDAPWRIERIDPRLFRLCSPGEDISKPGQRPRVQGYQSNILWGAPYLPEAATRLTQCGQPSVSPASYRRLPALLSRLAGTYISSLSRATLPFLPLSTTGVYSSAVPTPPFFSTQQSMLEQPDSPTASETKKQVFDHYLYRLQSKPVLVLPSCAQLNLIYAMCCTQARYTQL